MEIRLQGAQGRLAGPLHLDRLTLVTDKVSIRVEGVDLDHEFPSLLLGRFDLGRLEAGTVIVDVAPSTTPPAPGPPQFLPTWLSIGLRQVTIGQLEVGLPNGSRLAFSDVSASGTVTSSRIELDRAAVDAGDWTASGSVSLAAREPLRLEARPRLDRARGADAFGHPPR